MHLFTVCKLILPWYKFFSKTFTGFAVSFHPYGILVYCIYIIHASDQLYVYVYQEPAPQRVKHHVTSFTQNIINEGRLHYVQSSSNQTRDSFMFDVSNGISSIVGLVFHFIIIPQVVLYTFNLISIYYHTTGSFIYISCDIYLLLYHR